MRVCLGGHPNTRFSGHGEVKFDPFLLREGGLRGSPKSETGTESQKSKSAGREGGLPGPKHATLALVDFIHFIPVQSVLSTHILVRLRFDS